MWARGWVKGIAVVAGLAATGCDDGAGTGAGGSGSSSSASTADASSSTGAPACVSGLAQPDPACTACQDERCCATATAAATDPGTWTSSGAKICREASCFAECGVPEPECGGIVLDPASCTAAVRAKCCAELTACAQSDACTAIIYLCIDDQGCAPGSACFKTCTADFADGLPIFDAADDCLATVVCN